MSKGRTKKICLLVLFPANGDLKALDAGGLEGDDSNPIPADEEDFPKYNISSPIPSTILMAAMIPPTGTTESMIRLAGMRN